MTLHYEVSGEGPGLLLLHPAFTDRRAFEREAEWLASDHRVVRVDLPGHGETWARQPQLTMKGVSDGLAAVLDAEDVREVAVVGSSLGGLVAQDFARRHPGRVRGLFLEGAYEITDAEALKVQNAESLGIVFLALFRARRFREKIVLNSTAKDVGRAAMEPLVNEFRRSALRAFRGLETVVDPARGDALSAPVKLIMGEHEMPIARPAIRRWAEQAGHELQVFPGAGHCVHFDDPRAFAGSLRAWIAGLPG